MAVVNTRTARRLAALIVLGGLTCASPLHAQAAKPAPASPAAAAQTKTQAPAPSTAAPATAAPAGQPATPPSTVVPPNVAMPADYVIGPDDVLQIVFWSEKNLSSDVVVRPDGKVSLPLLNDVQAAGLTPEQLRKAVMDGASRFVTDPSVTVVVRTINSRKVYVTGQVNKPGPFPLTDAMTVLQMLALAGGIQEYADAQNILVMRTEQGQTKSFKFNYKEVRKGKNLQQNILLKPGDTIVVP
jgi:polysaccharide export outer membrane protein